MTTTPTGIPVVACSTCGLRHPANRRHCRTCGRPAAFLTQDGQCLHHPFPTSTTQHATYQKEQA